MKKTDGDLYTELDSGPFHRPRHLVEEDEPAPRTLQELEDEMLRLEGELLRQGPIATR